MASTTLVMFPVDAGRILANELREPLSLMAAFWLYYEEADEWRLVLATNLVDRDGRRSVYTKIQSFMRGRTDLKDIELSNISVVSPDDEVVRPIREAFDGIDLGNGRLIRRSRVTGIGSSVYLEEAFIYFAHR